jgi:hypothetical protein
MVKPLERNTRYVDAVMTVPKNTLYPMVGAYGAAGAWFLAHDSLMWACIMHVHQSPRCWYFLPGHPPD